MLEAILRFFRPKQRCFEATTSNGLLASYIIGIRRGEGGPRDLKLEKRLKVYGDKLARKRSGHVDCKYMPLRRVK